MNDGAYKLYDPETELLEFVDPYLKVEYNWRGKPEVKVYDIFNRI